MIFLKEIIFIGSFIEKPIINLLKKNQNNIFSSPLPKLPKSCVNNAMYRVECHNEKSNYVDNRHVRQYKIDFSKQPIADNNVQHLTISVDSTARFTNDLIEVGFFKKLIVNIILKLIFFFAVYHSRCFFVAFEKNVFKIR